MRRGRHHLEGLGAVGGDGLGTAVHRRPVLGASEAQRALACCAGPRIPGICGAGLVCLELWQECPLQPQISHLDRGQGAQCCACPSTSGPRHCSRKCSSECETQSLHKSVQTAQARSKAVRMQLLRIKETSFTFRDTSKSEGRIYSVF